MNYNNNELKFEPSASVNCLAEPCLSSVKLPKDQQFIHISHYRMGNLYTNSGNEVLAMKLIKDATDLKIGLISRVEYVYGLHPYTKVLDEFKIKYDQFVPEFNCFGYIFGNSEYRIPDPAVILKDEYIECEKVEAEIVVSYFNNAPFHSAIKKGDGYIAKSGVLALEKFTDAETAMRTLPYDYLRFYRRLD